MTAGAVGETRSDGRPELPRPLTDPVPEPPGGRVTTLPDEQEVLAAVLDAVSVAVVVHHRDGTPLLTNAAAQTLLDELPAGVLAPGTTEALHHRTARATARHLVVPSPALGAPGSDVGPRRLTATTVPLTFGTDRVTALVTTLRVEGDEHDQDAEQRLARAVTVAERRLRATIEHSPIGTAVLAPDGRFIQANATMCRLLGRSGAQMHGLTLADVTHRDDVEREAGLLARLVRGESEVYEIEKRLVRSGGDCLWARVTVSAVTDDEHVTQHLVVQALDVTETRLAVEMLTHQSLHDPLTGLPNRTLLLDRIQRALDRRRAGQGHLAVLCIDLDRFKVVNDSLGHHVGDRLLVQVARRLASVVPAGSLTARMGGDEFVVVPRPGTDWLQIRRLAQAIVESLRAPYVLPDTWSARPASASPVPPAGRSGSKNCWGKLIWRSTSPRTAAVTGTPSSTTRCAPAHGFATWPIRNCGPHWRRTVWCWNISRSSTCAAVG